MGGPRDLDFPSYDGRLRLYGRAYGADGRKHVIVCLHGLTRNSLDFDVLARRLAAAGNRVLAFDQRGRGRSSWDREGVNYQLDVYVRDMVAALDQMGVRRTVLIGTSMGGLMSMLMAVTAPDRIAGIVLNDVGPEVEARGLERIRGYVGRRPPPATWAAAAEAVAADNAVAFPDYGDDDWLAFARRVYIEDGDGRITAAYDPAIAEGLKPGETAVAPPTCGRSGTRCPRSPCSRFAARHPISFRRRPWRGWPPVTPA